MEGNGYTEEGFDEWVEENRRKNPQPPWVEMIMIEDELGIPNKEIGTTELEKAWAY